MGKVIDWKNKYEGSPKDTEFKVIEEVEKIEDTEQDSLTVIHQFVESFYKYEEKGIEAIHPYELNGFEVGLISYLNLLEKGLLPDVIKNINVLAVKKFERLTNLFPEVVIPQEFYIGFLKGFCSVY